MTQYLPWTQMSHLLDRLYPETQSAMLMAYSTDKGAAAELACLHLT